MATKTKNGDALLDRADEVQAEYRELLAEMHKARQPGYSQPQQMLRRYQPAAAGQRGPFNSFGQFLMSVRSCAGGNWHNNDLMKSWIGTMRKALPSGLNETVGADGGYLVPPEYAQQLLMRTYENDLLSRTVMFPLTSSNSIKIPAINETSRADGSRFGGVQAYWRSEAGSVSETKPGLAQVSLTVDSLTLLIRATQELLDDASSIALETYMNLVAPQELSFKIGDSIVNGDGVTKPLGLLNSTSKVAQAKETGQAAATIVAANILKMWSRLHVSCRQNAVWLIDQSIEPQLSQMTIGTAGANLVVYQPAGGLSAAPYATLLGKPVIVTEFGQQVGTEGDIILTDLGTYLTATKGGLQTASSIHVYFESNELVYRFIHRIDGRSWWFNALSPKSGGPSQTNIVTLATRS